MSCYTRHLGDWLPPDPTWLDRRALDEAVRSELGMETADCSEVWEAVKEKRDRLSESLNRGAVRSGTSGPSSRPDEGSSSRGRDAGEGSVPRSTGPSKRGDR